MRVERAKRAGSAVATGSAAAFIPPRPTLPKLRAAAAGCRGCHLWTVGTQTVFGEGPRDARVMLVGEQPGDQEDRAGRPFVGPAGALLDAALEQAQIPRDDVYVTNAVKHFKWERGEKSKRRIHKKPNDREIAACKPWLQTEIALVKPQLIVCLGATAAQALLGKQFRVTKDRGKPVRADFGAVVIATVHPSSVLRAPDPETRRRAEDAFFADLRAVARHLGTARREARAPQRAPDREIPLRGRGAPPAADRRPRATARQPVTGRSRNAREATTAEGR